MMTSTWMNAWDLHGRPPEAVVDDLVARGLNTCSLGFSYHGGRMILPRNASRVVYEQDRSALYFPTSEDKYRSLKLQPRVAPEAELVPPFLDACAAAGVDVNAWTVLCHNDRLGADHPECCIENVFGERYTYALCPSHPAVRRYATTLCADIVSTTPSLARLELEALSFMGYAHGSLHDKHGVDLPEWLKWLLSICVCPHCRERMETDTEALAADACTAVQRYFEVYPKDPSGGALRPALERRLGERPLKALIEMRRRTICSLLDDIRAAVGTVHVNLRMAPSPLFVGGKSALEWDDVAGRVDSVTLTFFGASNAEMAEGVADIPSVDQRPVPVYGGFIFHEPDCSSVQDVRDRTNLLMEADVDGLSFYCYSMATDAHLDWLQQLLLQTKEVV